MQFSVRWHRRLRRRCSVRENMFRVSCTAERTVYDFSRTIGKRARACATRSAISETVLLCFSGCMVGALRTRCLGWQAQTWYGEEVLERKTLNCIYRGLILFMGMSEKRRPKAFEGFVVEIDDEISKSVQELRT